MLAQAICKNPLDARCNGLRLLHLPLEQSEDPQSAFSFAQPPVSVRSMSDFRAWFYSTAASDAKALQSPNWLQQAGADHKKLYFPAESTINELSLRFPDCGDCASRFVARLQPSCECLFGAQACFLFTNAFLLAADSLALCRGAQKGFLGKMSCCACLQFVMPNTW